VALTDQDTINLHIAITAKVLNPDVKVICRAESHGIEENMESFGTDYVVDPFNTFAESLSTALHSPNEYLLSEWLRSESDEPVTGLPPVETGKWILCGYGRFGVPIYNQLIEAGVEVQVVEPYPEERGAPAGTVPGWGTEAVTLEEAGIRDAVGIVAGSNDDSNNLSIIVTAMQLNPDLFTVVRHTEHFNRVLFDNSHADIVMAPSAVVARKIRTLLTNPLVDNFLSLARAHNDDWAAAVMDELKRVSGNRIPELWEVSVTDDSANAVYNAIIDGQQVTISQLLTDHTDREHLVSAMALVHENESGSFSMPTSESVLTLGDKLLFAGTISSRSKMEWTLQNHVALEYVTTGQVKPQSYIGRLLFSG
jgi:Trk K+ transport system NAD-binding subunit